MKLLKWAHKNGCEILEDAGRVAAIYNNPEVLSWTMFNNIPTDPEIRDYALLGDNVELYQSLVEMGYEKTYKARIICVRNECSNALMKVQF